MFSRSRSVTRDKVNITIWKGTTMENTHRVYSVLVVRLLTRVMNQANMDVQIRITTTEPTVMTRVHSTAFKKP